MLVKNSHGIYKTVFFFAGFINVYLSQAFIFAQCEENNYYWIGTSSYWSMAENWQHTVWDPNIGSCIWATGVPCRGSEASIRNGGKVTLTSSASVTWLNLENNSTLIIEGGCLEISELLYISYGAFLKQISGTVSGRIFIGDKGNGKFIQSNGKNTLSLSIGANTNSFGIYELHAPAELETEIVDIGNSGTGEFIQTGGKHRARFERIGGWLGTGTYVHADGNHTITDLVIAEGNGSTGIYNMNTGYLKVNNVELIGCGGAGKFIQDGGNHTVIGGLCVGVFDNSPGNYYLNKGVLNLKGDCFVGGITEEEGPGSFVVNGGRINGISAESQIFVDFTGSMKGSGDFNIPVGYGSEPIYGTTGKECVEIDFKPKSLKTSGDFKVKQLTPQDFASGAIECLLPSSVFEVNFGGTFVDEFEIDIPYNIAEAKASGISEDCLQLIQETEDGKTFEMLDGDVNTDEDSVIAKVSSFGKFAITFCECCSSPVDLLLQGGGWGKLGEKRCGCEIPIMLEISSSCIKDRWCTIWDGSFNQCSIANQGCVLTSATMIINCLLGKMYTPSYINDEKWGIFDLNNIFYNRRFWDKQKLCRIKTNDVYWPYVKEFINLKSSRKYEHNRVNLSDTNNYPNNKAKEKKIAETICQWQVPVAVRVTGHTVVAYGFCKTDGKLRIKIRDPAGKAKYLDEYTNQKNIIKIDYIYPITGLCSALPAYASLLGPGEFVILDPNGLRTGFDPRTGISYNEIPGVAYWVEWPNEDLSELKNVDLDRNLFRKSAYIEMPPGETLLFEVIGSDYGQGIFAFESSGPNGDVQLLMEQCFELDPNFSDFIAIELPVLENTPPIANAGGNQTAFQRDLVILDGSGSTDADGDNLNYRWTLVSTPEGSSAVFENPEAIQTSFIADIPGAYVVSLIVNDGLWDSSPNTITVMVMSSKDAAYSILIETISTVNRINPEFLKNKNLANALSNKLNAALDMIGEGAFEEVLDKLNNDILQKTDGCAINGKPDKNDWIKRCQEQGDIYELIIRTIGFLEDLVE